MRLTVTHIGAGVATCLDQEGEECRVAFANTAFAALQEQLCIGDEIEALDGDSWRGTLRPSLIVLEPRYLIDVTTLCGCCKSFGFNARNALLGKFDSRTNTVPIQLGNLANDFFDNCVHSQRPKETCEQEDTCKGTPQQALASERFRRSVQRSFQTSPLAYTALGTAVNRDFFLHAEQLFRNISDTVPMFGEGLVLEPTFICPSLGLQGRMDALRADRSIIVELKSGKCDEWRRGSKCKAEHELQMMLYNSLVELNC